MYNISKDKINFYKNKPLNKEKKTKKITYNKPLFINIKNENNITDNSFHIITKNSTCSTKICSAKNESPYDTIINNNNTINNTKGNININRVYSFKDLDIDNNNNCYSKTSLNFFFETYEYFF